MIDIPTIGKCFAGANPTVKVKFFDERDEPVTPTSVSYTVVDWLTGTSLVGATSVTATTTYVTITLPTAATTIQTATKLTEPHLLKVTYVLDSTRINHYLAFINVVNR